MSVTTAFLDRDGTLNRKAAEGSYITDPAELELLPGAARAVARLNAAGVRVVVITNQRCVALGLLSPPALDEIHEQLSGALAAEGARLDAIYVCPHAADSCDCRKPLPGLLLRAAADLPGVDLASAVMVGDTEHDVDAGRAAGAGTVRLGPVGTVTSATVLASDLASAVDWVLTGSSG